MFEKTMTTAAKAWPHFVPRAELDLELGKLAGRLDEASKRMSRLEPKLGRLDARIDALAELCGGETRIGVLAGQSELSALELRLSQRWAKEASDLAVELEELRRSTAEASAVEGLRRDHAVRLDGLATGITSAEEGLLELSRELQADRDFSKATFATRSQLRDSCDQLQNVDAQMSTEMRDAEQKLQALHDAMQLAEVGIASADLQLQQLDSSGQVTSTGLEELRGELHSLQVALRGELATKTALQEVAQVAADAHERLDFADKDRDNISSKLQQDSEILQQMLTRQVDTFQEFDRAIERVNACSEMGSATDRRCSRQDAALEELSTRQDDHHKSLETLEARRAADVIFIEDLCNSLQQQFLAQVDKVNQTMAELGVNSTRISLEQMDKTLNIRRSLDELSEEHAQLRSTVAGTAVVKPVRSDGEWQVSRSVS
mmetsp:Transcript_63972/g.113766  ORF Transcript_63972/g.113766 Transcript_63972/m.113766 type:complete len:433 (+) Transcript_63972:29-1327(+)